MLQCFNVKRTSDMMQYYVCDIFCSSRFSHRLSSPISSIISPISPCICSRLPTPKSPPISALHPQYLTYFFLLHIFTYAYTLRAYRRFPPQLIPIFYLFYNCHPLFSYPSALFKPLRFQYIAYSGVPMNCESDREGEVRRGPSSDYVCFIT